MKLSFAKLFAINGIPDISIFHDTSTLVLFTNNEVNVTDLVPVIGPYVYLLLLIVLDAALLSHDLYR
jgi:hypothetical protein